MFKLIFIAILLAAAPFGSQAQSAPRNTTNEISPINLGQAYVLRSSILSEDRTLNIYLPPSYSSSDTTHFQVIYLLDGGTDEDFIHIVGLVQYLNFPWVGILKEAIVVGIGNVDRKRDFTYLTTIPKDKQTVPTHGGSSRFIKFVEKELQPYINHKFRTNGSATIVGQSLAGLLAAEILVKRPSLFSKYIIISPSLWWDNRSLEKSLNTSELMPPGTRPAIYIAVGEEGKEMKEAVKGFYQTLKKKEQGNPTIYFDYYPDESHATIYHLAVYRAFEKLNL